VIGLRMPLFHSSAMGPAGVRRRGPEEQASHCQNHEAEEASHTDIKIPDPGGTLDEATINED